MSVSSSVGGTPVIAGIGSAFPPNHYDQETLIEAFKEHWSQRHHNLGRLEAIHRNVMVGGRHLALPLEDYGELRSWGEANDVWIRVGQEVGAEATARALAAAGLTADDVDALIFVSVTGVATPSLDARLINRLGLPPRVKRMPIFGLGCVAGAAGIARAADYLRAFPDQVVVLLAVELCSLTLQREDLSVANIIASGLFGDGAAAVVLVGGERPGPAGPSGPSGPRVVASRSVFYPDTEEVMGWQISERGFSVLLSPAVPEMVHKHLRHDVDAFLSDHGRSRAQLSSWVSHPGGPRVLSAMQEALELPTTALEPAWRSLREVGNLSSASVLLVLEQVLSEARPEAGSHGLLLAMGPGFCSELVLLSW